MNDLIKEALVRIYLNGGRLLPDDRSERCDLDFGTFESKLRYDRIAEDKDFVPPGNKVTTSFSESDSETVSAILSEEDIWGQLTDKDRVLLGKIFVVKLSSGKYATIFVDKNYGDLIRNNTKLHRAKDYLSSKGVAICGGEMFLIGIDYKFSDIDYLFGRPLIIYEITDVAADSILTVILARVVAMDDGTQVEGEVELSLDSKNPVIILPGTVITNASDDQAVGEIFWGGRRFTFFRVI